MLYRVFVRRLVTALPQLAERRLLPKLAVTVLYVNWTAICNLATALERFRLCRKQDARAFRIWLHHSPPISTFDDENLLVFSRI